MRTKLLTTAALALALPMSFAAADTTPIVKPDKTPLNFSVNPDKPDLPEIDKPLPTDALFGDDPQSQTANLEQTMTNLGGLVNDGTIEQTGDQNQAQLTQTGNDNGATIVQSDLGAPGSFNVATNLGVIDQNGNGNFAEVEQINTADGGPSNVASVHQFSDTPEDGTLSNEALVSQDGLNGSVALIVQGASDAGTTNNFASIDQFGGSADRADARIDQQSDGNSADVLQGFGLGGGDVRIQQTGFDGAGFAEANEASVIQGPGSDLEVNILQSSEEPPALGVDGANFAFVDQIGDGSTVNIEQRNDGNNAEVFQNADHSDVHILQNDVDSVGQNFALVAQEGDGNSTVIEQENVDNDAFVEQFGDGGTILVDQNVQFGDGPEGTNIVDLFQDSDTVDSTIEVEQDHRFTDDNANVVFVDQIGVTNGLVQVAQTGEGHDASIVQGPGSDLTVQLIQGGPGSFFRSNNEAIIFQSGDRNEITVFQEDDGNVAEISQEGSDNSISLEQLDDNFAMIDQGGHRNSIHVFQTGDDDIATVTQFANDSVINVIQNGGGNIANVSQLP
ncbi:MAG: hypothetical protein AAF683_03215 [Pseudomonadota bacterium]